ncbi:MAG: hypothetical protein HZA94_03690 [Candidatus Vogelbacteria bacterium]|nr:hypothetical protein [Candidatus Vogelbacteria bacterium]
MFLNKFEELNIDGISYKISILSFLGVVLFSILYIYLLNSSVFNVVIREKNNSKIRETMEDVAILENRYISTRNDINLEMAYTLGYRDDFNNVHFSTETKGLAGGLSLLGNEVR